MTHFIIKLVGVSRGLGIRKSGEFRWLDRHNALCYEGREIPIAEHNTLVPKVLEKYKDHMPRLPQVVLLALDASTPPPAASRPSTPLPPLPVADEPSGSGEVSRTDTGIMDTEAPGDGVPPAPEAEVRDPVEADPAPKTGRPPKYTPEALAKSAKKAPAKK